MCKYCEENKIYSNHNNNDLRIMFRETVLNGIKECPKNWRKGQKVFNYIDNHYNVARKVQHETKIDCFYDDKLIDKFIEESFKLINNYAKN